MSFLLSLWTHNMLQLCLTEIQHWMCLTRSPKGSLLFHRRLFVQTILCSSSEFSNTCLWITLMEDSGKCICIFSDLKLALIAFTNPIIYQKRDFPTSSMSMSEFTSLFSHHPLPPHLRKYAVHSPEDSFCVGALFPSTCFTLALLVSSF